MAAGGAVVPGGVNSQVGTRTSSQWALADAAGVVSGSRGACGAAEHMQHHIGVCLKQHCRWYMVPAVPASAVRCVYVCVFMACLLVMQV